MLRRCSGLAAIASCLISTTPAGASPNDEASLSSDTRADAIVLSGIVRKRGNLSLAYSSDLRDAGFDEVPIGQRGMIGQLPLHERVALGVGLFSVTGANVKERELKRTDPMRDVAPRTSRVAGAGLRLNF